MSRRKYFGENFLEIRDQYIPIIATFIADWVRENEIMLGVVDGFRLGVIMSEFQYYVRCVKDFRRKDKFESIEDEKLVKDIDKILDEYPVLKVYLVEKLEDIITERTKLNGDYYGF